LRELTLHGALLTQATLATLARLPCLRVLNLTDCRAVVESDNSATVGRAHSCRGGFNMTWGD
jgi:hypothetical protein